MTRHTWRPGDAIDPGATYYPMDGSRQCDPLGPDDVIAALDAHMEHTGIVDAMAQEIENLRAELDGREKVELPPGWSDEWLDWHGAEHSPLPGDTMVQDYDDGGHCRLASAVTWAHVRRFRYQGDWLPRGDWIPPAELWDAGCPVRVEWVTCMDTDSSRPGIGRLVGNEWRAITHIRLRPRHPKAELPEGWRINDGALTSPWAMWFNPFYRDKWLAAYRDGSLAMALEAWELDDNE